MKKLSIAIIILFFSTCIVYSMPSVQPLLVETHRQDSFIVSNPSDSPQKFSIVLKDFDQNFNIHPYGSLENSLSLTISPKQFVLQPEEKKKIKITSIEDRGAKTKWAMAIVQRIKKEEKGVTVQNSIGVQIMQYAIRPEREFYISRIKKNYFILWNSGDTPEYLNGRIKIISSKGKVVLEREFKEILVLPYSKKKVPYDYDGEGRVLVLIPYKGSYKAQRKDF